MVRQEVATKHVLISAASDDLLVLSPHIKGQNLLSTYRWIHLTHTLVAGS